MLYKSRNAAEEAGYSGSSKKIKIKRLCSSKTNKPKLLSFFSDVDIFSERWLTELIDHKVKYICINKPETNIQTSLLNTDFYLSKEKQII